MPLPYRVPGARPAEVDAPPSAEDVEQAVLARDRRLSVAMIVLATVLTLGIMLAVRVDRAQRHVLGHTAARWDRSVATAAREVRLSARAAMRSADTPVTGPPEAPAAAVH